MDKKLLNPAVSPIKLVDEGEMVALRRGDDAKTLIQKLAAASGPGLTPRAQQEALTRALADFQADGFALTDINLEVLEGIQWRDKNDAARLAAAVFLTKNANAVQNELEVANNVSEALRAVATTHCGDEVAEFVEQFRAQLVRKEPLRYDQGRTLTGESPQSVRDDPLGMVLQRRFEVQPTDDGQLAIQLSRSGDETRPKDAGRRIGNLIESGGQWVVQRGDEVMPLDELSLGTLESLEGAIHRLMNRGVDDPLLSAVKRTTARHERNGRALDAVAGARQVRRQLFERAKTERAERSNAVGRALAEALRDRATGFIERTTHSVAMGMLLGIPYSMNPGVTLPQGYTPGSGTPEHPGA